MSKATVSSNQSNPSRFTDDEGCMTASMETAAQDAGWGGLMQGSGVSSTLGSDVSSAALLPMVDNKIRKALVNDPPEIVVPPWRSGSDQGGSEFETAVGAHTMNPYHHEQIEALLMARELLGRLDRAWYQRLHHSLADYLSFRHDVDRFLARHFSRICSHKCFQSHLSACCAREGIITFFADVVINAMVAPGAALDRLQAALQQDNPGLKCVYLGPSGCLWRLKPIVCQMFLCDAAQKTVFEADARTLSAWEALKRREKGFRWPDQPVLFDQIEALFIEHGFNSPLMYLHNSPGLLRIKRQAHRKAPPDGAP